MTTFKKWNRADHVEQAGGEEALAATRRIVDEFIADRQLRVGKFGQRSARIVPRPLSCSGLGAATRPLGSAVISAGGRRVPPR